MKSSAILFSKTLLWHNNRAPHAEQGSFLIWAFSARKFVSAAEPLTGGLLNAGKTRLQKAYRSYSLRMGDFLLLRLSRPKMAQATGY